MRVSCALNMLIWHCIDEERDDESFMRVERVSWYTVSIIWMCWKLGHETSTETGLSAIKLVLVGP